MSNQLHVVHVMLSLDVGGLERNVLNQTRHAAKTGQKMSIVCLERPGALAQQVEATGSRVICTNKKPGIRLGIIGRLIEAFRQLQPDVVHTHQIASLFYAGPAAKRAGVALVVHTEHGKENYETQLRTRMLGRLAALFSETFYCLTEDMAQAVRAAGIVADRKIKVIFNGIDTSQFREKVDTESARNEMGIPAGAPVIGTVGRLTEVKRQDILIRGFAKLKKNIPTAHLLVVGDGPLMQELKDLAASCGVADSTHFAGNQPRPAPFIQLMNIFALTSRSEGMPQAAIEASVTGLPVVASRVGGLPELIDDGKTGLLFPVGDDGALAAAIVELLNDPIRAAKMGTAARERAIAKFDISRMAADYNRDFIEALSRGLSPATAI